MPDIDVVGVSPTVEIANTAANRYYFDVPIVAAQKDDIVVAWHWWAHAYQTVSANPQPPITWDILHQYNTNLPTAGALVAKHTVVTDTLASVRFTRPAPPPSPPAGLVTWPGTPVLYAGSMTLRYADAVTWTNINFGTITGSAGAWSMTTPTFSTASADSLAVLVGLMGAGISGGAAFSSLPPGDPWVQERANKATGAQTYYAASVITQWFDSAIAAGTMTWSSTATPAVGVIFGFYATPLEPDVILPIRPAPLRLRLGCASSYNAFITDGSYRTTIAQVPFSSVKCERVLDEISTAQVVVPDELQGAFCTSTIAGLEPWRYGLFIERDDAEVWSGAVVGMQRNPGDGSLTIQGADVMVRQQKNYAIWSGEVEYVDADAAVVFRDIINTHSVQPVNRWSIVCPEFVTGQSLTRSLYAARREIAYSVLQEILDSAVDAYVMNGKLHVWSQGEGWKYNNGRTDVVVDGAYNRWFGLEYGIFTNDSFSELPPWSIAGADQANYVDAPYADVGEKGYRVNFNAQDLVGQQEAGMLVYVDANTMHRPDEEPPATNDAAFQRRADSLLASKHQAPAVMSGGVLSEDAPITVDHLRPGGIWRMDIHDFGFTQLLQVGVLKRVEFSWERGVESIRPTLIPIGYQDETD